MDILLQYLNIKKNKQEYIKVINLPCSLVCQALELKMADRAYQRCGKKSYPYHNLTAP